MNIVMYTKSNCPNCEGAKQLLFNKGLSFITYEPELHKAEFAWLFAEYPEARQMPQIFVNGVRIGGLAGLQAYLPDILAGRMK